MQLLLPSGACSLQIPLSPLGCGEGSWRSSQLPQPRSASLQAFVLFFFFQIFLSYTEAGSSFMFGDTLVKDVFAFQVS